MMTRELDVEYGKLCVKCKKRVLEDNMKLLERLTKGNSLRVVEKLTGIPRTTLARMSESLSFRTSGISTHDAEKASKIDIDVTELSKRIKELGQNDG